MHYNSYVKCGKWWYFFNMSSCNRLKEKPDFFSMQGQKLFLFRNKLAVDA
jgi:hypothetical protein